MAAEVLQQNYGFMRELIDLKTLFEQGPVDEVENKVPFEHNYAHDVESLFWLAVFILFFNEDIHALPETEEIAQLRKEYSAYVFPGNMTETRANRGYLIHNPKELMKYTRWFGDSFKKFLSPLLWIASLFGSGYSEIYTALRDGTTPKNEIGAYELLYHATITSFGRCQVLSENMEIRSRKLKGLDQGNNNAPQQPESNSNDQQPSEPTPNERQPSERRADGNPRKRELKELVKEEYKISNSPEYPRRR